MKEKLLGMNPEQLRQAAQDCGLKPFVGNQLAGWLYSKRASTWDQMTNIGKDAKAKLQEKYDLGTSPYIGLAESSDGTKKYLFGVSAGSCRTGILHTTRSSEVRDRREPGDVMGAEPPSNTADAVCVEAVMIPDEDRKTLCVSSQAGCKMGCKFCMTGRQGWHGNLDAADILNQFISIDEAEALTNTVFMGMGEPLDNYEAVSKAIEVFTADWGFGWSPKRITLSTIGVIPTLKKYLDEQRCHLAVSLHNPFPEERLEMMPVQKAYPIKDVINLLKQYDWSAQRRVSFEYTMFAGFNDDKRHADGLIRLLSGMECRVNLIRFHKIPDFPYDCATDFAMQAFRDRLNAHGITCTIRASRGEDILAACGMLAGKHQEK